MQHRFSLETERLLAYRPVSWLLTPRERFSSGFCRNMLISSPVSCMPDHAHDGAGNVLWILSAAQPEAISHQIVSTRSSHCKLGNNIWIWLSSWGKPKTKERFHSWRESKPLFSLSLSLFYLFKTPLNNLLWAFYLQEKFTSPSPVVLHG